ncbi:MAG: hypothetical protein IT441_10605 [Phycisphaeraceae bacterium]|nr:hypothetical protein [Phycisphaeraceae bacterium]
MLQRQTVDLAHDPRPDLAGLRLREVVLLAGVVRPTPLTSAVGRALLDLPLAEHTSLMSVWQAHLQNLAHAIDAQRLTVRVMLDQGSPEPQPAPADHLDMIIQRDPEPLRGTGGVLRDTTLNHHDDDWILVAPAAQLLLEPLEHLLASMNLPGYDVVVMAHGDGVPTGLMLLRAKVLRSLPSLGFVDLKEQGLPRIAANHPVGVVRLGTPVSLPVRSLQDYLHAASLYARRQPHTGRMTDNPFEEHWRSSFLIVEPGASVSPSALLHDSVVLAGAVIEADAVVVSSVVGPAAVVAPRSRVIDQLIAPARRGRPA